MPSKDSKADKGKDARTLAIDSNPCGICRAMGSPSCKGHGSTGGGLSGSSGSGGSSSASNLPVKEPLGNLKIIALSLAKNPAWTQSDNAELTFEFTHPDALLSIKLEMDRGVLIFSGHKNLTTEQQETLDDFLKHVEMEFNSFKNELTAKGIDIQSMSLTRTGNDLSIKIPSPKYYDTFVQRLIDKNILVTRPPEPSQNKREAVLLESQAKTEQDPTPTAPAPFDISGPKPKGWDTES